MEKLGEDQSSLKFDFETFMLRIGNEQVKDLLHENELDKANEISLFIFSFAKEKKLYHHADASHPNDATHSEVLLKTSLDIMTDIIDAINSLDLVFETLPSEDLIGLLHLLYIQSNCKQLERVVSPLWNMRSDLPTVFDSGFPTIAEIGTMSGAFAMDDGSSSYAMHFHETLLSKTAELHLELLKKLLSLFKDSELENTDKREKTFHDLSAKLNADFTFEGMTGDLPSWKYTLPTTWKFGELEEQWKGADTLETSKREWVLASRIFY
ncbi:hypothetical protein ACSS6W_010033 [Trichoderma asperelloides]